MLCILTVFPEVPGVVERRSQVTRIRLERIEIAEDLSHSRIVGTTDGGTVRVTSKPAPLEIGLAFALAASVAGPLDLDLPEDGIDSVKEIDPSDPAG
jgi:hypothetical protein